MMTLRQAADSVAMSPSHLRLLCRRGVIPAEKVGRDWVIKISQADLLKKLEKRPRVGKYSREEKKVLTS
jgi:hypothetical protein